MNKIKSIFSRDIGKALNDARADERKDCEKEKDQALELLEKRLESKWKLKLKIKESKIASLELRAEQNKKKEKLVEDERQRLREQAVLLRKIIEDLKYLSDIKRQESIENAQVFDRLMKEIDEVKKIEDQTK